MGLLSPENRTMIQIMRDAGLLCDNDARLLNAPKGAIVIPCSDGDQMPDVFYHQERLAKAGGWPVRPHMPSLHGGAMLIAKDCPLYRVAADGVTPLNVDVLLLQHIREASSEALKGIETAVLYVHAPCGAASLAGLTFVHQVVYLMQAKERVKTQDPKMNVVCFVHVDYGHDRKRTYFLSRDKFIEFWNAEGRKLWGHLFPKDPFPPKSRRRGDFGSTVFFAPDAIGPITGEST